MTAALKVFLTVNAASFILMGVDKFKAAHGRWRISEGFLFLLPLLGGASGGTLGMYLFHHKTNHWYFAWGLPILAVIQLIVLIALKTKGKL